MSEPVNWSLLELCLRAETCKEEMRYVPRSSLLLFLGVLLLEIIAYHYGNANPALKIQQRTAEEVSANGTDEALRGEGQPCDMTEQCNSTLCCLRINGTSTCQKRPNEAGENCSLPVMLTPFGDEGPYPDACPCTDGLTCVLTKDEKVETRSASVEQDEGHQYGVGTCRRNGSTPKPSVEVEESSS
uniref:Ixodegrin B n=1 Tax=Rhipicephalus appendiculatus TaxID=34631 RepID=A0A131Z5Y3_RHIAP